jgi:hypothetical protein
MWKLLRDPSFVAIVIKYSTVNGRRVEQLVHFSRVRCICEMAVSVFESLVACLAVGVYINPYCVSDFLSELLAIFVPDECLCHDKPLTGGSQLVYSVDDTTEEPIAIILRDNLPSGDLPHHDRWKQLVSLDYPEPPPFLQNSCHIVFPGSRWPE